MTFTYIGIDESTLRSGTNSLTVVAAVTEDKTLTKSKGYAALPKARDHLTEFYAHMSAGSSLETAPRLPRPDEMKGLQTYHWMRANEGRFSRQLIEHAAIAHLVTVNGYDSQKTVLFIDMFYLKEYVSKQLIKEYLHALNFKIPLQNIELHAGGDKSIPLINYADLLAFQIGMHVNKKYQQRWKIPLTFPFTEQEVPYDERRVKIPLGEQGRTLLERIVKDVR
ncbi:MAG: hypothetical protein V1725_04185 [archaeon]